MYRAATYRHRLLAKVTDKKPTRSTKILVAIGLSAVMIVTGSSLQSPKANALVSSYPVPTAGAGLNAITKDSNGDVWFVEHDANKIGKMTPTGLFTEYPVPTAFAQVHSITKGPDGAIWFTEQFGSSNGAIAKIASDGTVTEYPVPVLLISNPTWITVGSDGALWFTASLNWIGRITTSGNFSWYFAPSCVGGNGGQGCQYGAITSGPDGALWYANSNANLIGRMTTSGAVQEYALPTQNSLPYGIVSGNDGLVWFTENSASKVGSISVTGVINEYPTKSQSAHPGTMSVGSDQSVWFTESGKVGRVSSSGVTSEHSLGYMNSTPTDVAVDADGMLWVTDPSTNSIVHFTAAPSIPTNLRVNSPTKEPVLTWNGVSDVEHYDIYRDGVKIGSSTGESYTDQNASEGTRSYYVVSVNSAGSTSEPSNTVTSVVDRTAPVLSTLNWTINPKRVTESTGLSVEVSDSLSGVSGGEYFIGTDPGQGNATAMTLNGSTLAASLSTNLTAGVYNIGVRAIDAAGNWTSTATTMLVVYDPSGLGVTGKNKKDLIPNLTAGDQLPGLVSSTQTDPVDYGFTVGYKNGVLDPHNDFQLTYRTGTNCGKANAVNCHSFVLNASGFDWLVIDQANNSHGHFQGQAIVTVDGSSTTNPFTAEVVDGDRASAGTNDSVIFKVYAPNANPTTASPMYRISGPVTKSNGVVIR